MQRVVRSTFAVLTLAGLAACGDKVTVIQPDTTTPPGQVQSVTVTPSTVSLSPQQTASLVATVTADPSITDRTVTWSSSNTAVVTVSSAGPSTQVTITAVAAGTAAIVARSNASNVVSGAAAVTVTALPPVSVSIGSINQGANIGGLLVGVPADLTNAQGQLDITLNVESGNLPLQSVTTILRCGTDSLVQTQTISAAVAELAAEEAAVPITLSVNTSQLNTAGTAPLLRNNQACTIRSIARTTSGTQSASGTTTLAVNNPDMILATATFPRQASDPLARVWYGGQDAPVTVTVRPIFFSGRTPVSANVTLVNAGLTQTVTTSPFTVSFPTSAASAGVDPNSLWGITDPNERLAISVLDNQGNTIVGSPNFGQNPMIITFASTTPSTTVTPPGQTPTSGLLNGNFARFNLDVSPPEVDDLDVNFNTLNATNGYIGTGFSFAATSPVFLASALNVASTLTSLGYANTTLASDCVNVATATAIADGALCDNGGVDRVTLTTQFTTSNPASSTSTFTTFTAISALTETAAGNAYGLRIQACDALNNCNNTAPTQLGRFGVDLTPPTLVVTSGPTNNGVYGIGATVPGGAFFAIADPQGAGGVAGSGGASPAAILVTLQGLVPSGATGSQTTCFIGQVPATNQNVACSAAITQATLASTSVFGTANLSGTSITLPTGAGEYTLTVRALDQAGNVSPPTTIRWYVDQAAPTVAAGVAIPASITTGSTFSVTAADNMDVAAGNGYLNYTVGGGFRFFETGTASPAGVTFDNALTRSSTITVPLAVWFRSLTTTIGTAGVKPDVLGLRAIDAASNLSNPEIVNLPALNIANGSTISGTSTTNGITSQVLTISPNPIWAGGTTTANPGTATLTYTVQALNQTTATPFSQVCFYFRSPTGAQGGASGVAGAATGDLIQIGCTTAVLTTTPNATDKFFTYSTTWTPPVALGGTAPQLYAVGITSNTDAIISAPVVLTINVLP